MRSVRVWLFLLAALCLLYPATGWLTPVIAAQGEEAISTTAEGKTPTREEAKEEAKEDECPATFGPIITDTAIPIEKGRFALQPTWGLSFVTNTFSPSWRRIPAGGDFKSFGMSVKFTYGLFNNLEVYTVIPYIHNWADGVEARGPNGERSADFGGISDVNLTFKYRLVAEGPVAPTTSAIFAVGFPSGHSRHLNPVRLGTDVIGGGAYVLTTGLNLSKYLRPFIFYGNFHYSFRTDVTTEGKDENGGTFLRVNHPRDFVTVNLAAEYPITKKWVALVELTSIWDGGRLFGAKGNIPPGALLSLLPGIEYMATEKFSLALGVNISLYGKNNDAVITPILSMVYAF